MMFSVDNRRHISYVLFISLFTLFSLASCSGSGESDSKGVSEPAAAYPEYAEETASPAESYPEYAEEVASPADRQSKSKKHTTSYPKFAKRTKAHPKPEKDTNRINEYRVVLGADKTIKIPGLPGELRVWIGGPIYKPDFPDRMIQDEAAVPAVGESATVQPFAPAFKIHPIETQCMKIHPSGSEVRFKLIPQKQGRFEVGANVFLFDSLDCSGAPIPKIASTLKVLVEVDPKNIFLEKTNELWNVFWGKFVEFWAAFVTILFGVLLFLIRGKLKKWFGYEDNQ